MRLQLEDQARRLGVEAECLGDIPDHEIPHYLNQCQVFAFPPLYEGHPKALLEAMACGLPVVATPVSGVENLIEHGETGYLCANTSAEAIREGLREVLANAELRRNMAQHARRFVMENFSLEKVLSKELSVYERMGLVER